MKKFLILFFITLSFYTLSYSQSDCALSSIGASNSPSFTGIDFFSESVCEPLILKCNIVILTRDDGTGGFSPTNTVWTDWENAMNLSLANIQDPNCFTVGYPLDSKIRVKFTTHTLPNTSAYDWYDKANDDQLSSSIQPNRYICPRVGTTWSSLEEAMTTFEQSHFGEINFFFIENGELVSLLETHIANGTTPSAPYIDRFEKYYLDHPACTTGCGPIATGCSTYPKPYYSQASKNSYIIANRYSDYLIRQKFHAIWWPQYAHLPPSTVWGWSFDINKLMLLHEMCHNLMDFLHDNTCNQLMSTLFTRSNFIPKDKLNAIHKNLATTDLHNAVDCNALSDEGCAIRVSSNATISGPISVFGDLIIEDGISLTITSDVYFSEYSSIIVKPHAKLIVDGGTLTNGCGDFWKGIIVYGGNTDFDVEIKNSARIYNTSKAAVSMFSPESWPLAGNYGNGILHAENSTFNNCRRMVEFMSWSPMPNTSYIRGCVQNGGKWGITNWNCQGIEVTDNIFNGMSSSCIVSEAGSFEIINNFFKSNENDILFNNVSAGLPSQIEHNDFYGSNIGYNARGTILGINKIFENSFHTNYIDALNDGNNNYNMLNNEFYGPIGSVSFENGPGSGIINMNKFSDNFIGTLTSGSNSNLNFIQNCFSTTFKDVYINGSVSPIISNGVNPANNCFTHHGNTSSPIQELGGSPFAFKYVEPNDNFIDCRDAILAHPNVIREYRGSSIPLSSCGILYFGGNPDTLYQDECYPISNSSSNLNSFNSLNNKIAEILQNSNLPLQQKEFELAIYRRCLDRVTISLFEGYIKSGNYTNARNLYNGNASDNAIISVFSSYVQQNYIDSARYYINQIPINSEAMQDFKIIQNINLNRIPYGPFYHSSSSELNAVRLIALKSHPNSTFAKALYYALTGEVISSEIPIYSSQYLNPHSNNSGNNEVIINCIPSPFNQELRIEINGASDFNINIQDINNKIVYSSLVKSNLIILDTRDWQNGVYIIKAFRDKEVIAKKKVVLIR
ncbi:MAG: hypothetical protein IPK88_16765 [Saprospiraceae bacterium]|nr:hypothetical protein [Candidatus Defluviibacterium haderslevense]